MHEGSAWKVVEGSRFGFNSFATDPRTLPAKHLRISEKGLRIPTESVDLISFSLHTINVIRLIG